MNAYAQSILIAAIKHLDNTDKNSVSFDAMKTMLYLLPSETRGYLIEERGTYWGTLLQERIKGHVAR